MTINEAVAKIKRDIGDDTSISGAKYLLVFGKKKTLGFLGNEEIRLSGYVDTEEDKRKAEEIAKRSAEDRAVVNEIEVSPRKK